MTAIGLAGLQKVDRLRASLAEIPGFGPTVCALARLPYETSTVRMADIQLREVHDMMHLARREETDEGRSGRHPGSLGGTQTGLKAT
jgi:hypothetical protein